MKSLIPCLFLIFLLPTQAQNVIYTSLNVDTAPVIENCENMDSQECFQNSIRDYINKNLDITRLVGGSAPKSYKAYAQFVIGENGEIRDIKIRSTNDIFEKVSLELIQKLKISEAAKKDGKYVASRYTVPIMFNQIITNDLNKYTSAGAIVPIEKATTPPVLQACPDQDPLDCMEKIIDTGMKNILAQDNYKAHAKIKYYVEINSQGNALNALVIIDDVNEKKKLESFLNNLVFTEPAKDSSGTGMWISHLGELSL